MINKNYVKFKEKKETVTCTVKQAKGIRRVLKSWKPIEMKERISSDGETITFQVVLDKRFQGKLNLLGRTL